VSSAGPALLAPPGPAEDTGPEAAQIFSVRSTSVSL